MANCLNIIEMNLCQIGNLRILDKGMGFQFSSVIAGNQVQLII
jgi:hypothetical protein